jgi:hypothetical protein
MTPQNFQIVEFADHIITERQDERKRSYARSTIQRIASFAHISVHS